MATSTEEADTVDAVYKSVAILEDYVYAAGLSWAPLEETPYNDAISGQVKSSSLNAHIILHVTLMDGTDWKPKFFNIYAGEMDPALENMKEVVIQAVPHNSEQAHLVVMYVIDNSGGPVLFIFRY